jgi:excisionase family DNA binding protein
MAGFVTLQQVADLFHVDVRSVHRWITAGRFPTYKPGKERLVKQDDLDAFIESVKDAPGRRGSWPRTK